MLGIGVGIGLSAACGFRVFVPLLVMNLASLSGYLHLGSGFAWIGSYYATVAFGTATIVEVLESVAGLSHNPIGTMWMRHRRKSFDTKPLFSTEYWKRRWV